MTIDMTLDFSYDAEPAELAETVRRWCSQHAELVADTVDGPFPAAVWDGLAGIGILGLGTATGGGGAIEIAAAMEELGAADVPGPLVATFIANQLLEPEEQSAIADGRLVVSVGTPPLMPWAPAAGVFIVLDGDEAWRGQPASAIEPVSTLGGEPWGRVDLARSDHLGGASRALAIGDVALGAYLAGAGERLRHVATEHARDRVQFGKPIGDFQAVAHPLADVHVRLTAARHLVRVAAHAIDSGGPNPSASAATARLSATRASLDAAQTAHQTFGAMGFIVEGPVGSTACRIRHLSLLPPGPSRARQAVLAPLMHTALV